MIYKISIFSPHRLVGKKEIGKKEKQDKSDE